MSETRKVLDPFADPEERETPLLKIGDREYELVTDLVASVHRKVVSLQKRFVDAANGDGDPLADDVARIVGDMAEVTTVDSAGLSDVIVGLWDADKIGMRKLETLARFIAEHLAEDADPEG